MCDLCYLNNVLEAITTQVLTRVQHSVKITSHGVSIYRSGSHNLDKINNYTPKKVMLLFCCLPKQSHIYANTYSMVFKIIQTSGDFCIRY